MTTATRLPAVTDPSAHGARDPVTAEVTSAMTMSPRCNRCHSPVAVQRITNPATGQSVTRPPAYCAACEIELRAKMARGQVNAARRAAHAKRKGWR